MRKLRFILPILAATFSLASCDWIQINPKSKTEEGEYGAFYSGYNLDLKGGRLQNELQKLCWEKHTQWVTYGQLNNYFKLTSDHNSAEAIADGSNINQYFYNGAQKTGYGTREHVWPCANSSQLWVHDDGAGNHYVDRSYYVGGGSDLFHVRTCDSNMNTARGNSKFVDFDDPEFSSLSGIESYPASGSGWKIKIQGHDENYEYAQKCEPDDNMKGDIARIVVYVWLHYAERGITPSGSVNSSGHMIPYKDMTGALELTNILGYSTVERCQEKLKEWNKLDPVSEVETLRNDTVQGIQGNRNPFVDYPELMDRIF